MHLEITRRRFIAWLSSLMVFSKTGGVAWAQSRLPASPGLKSPARDVLIWFSQAGKGGPSDVEISRDRRQEG